MTGDIDARRSSRVTYNFVQHVVPPHLTPCDSPGKINSVAASKKSRKFDLSDRGYHTRYASQSVVSNIRKKLNDLERDVKMSDDADEGSTKVRLSIPTGQVPLTPV